MIGFNYFCAHSVLATAMPLSLASTYVHATFHHANLFCISFCTAGCLLFAFANTMKWNGMLQVSLKTGKDREERNSAGVPV